MVLNWPHVSEYSGLDNTTKLHNYSSFLNRPHLQLPKQATYQTRARLSLANLPNSNQHRTNGLCIILNMTGIITYILMKRSRPGMPQVHLRSETIDIWSPTVTTHHISSPPLAHKSPTSTPLAQLPAKQYFSNLIQSH